MSDVLSEIDKVHTEARIELAAINTPELLEQFRIKYLGANGAFKAMMKLLGQVPREQKPAVGQKANTARTEIEAAFEEKKSSLAATPTTLSGVDITEPGLRPHLGRRHILMKVVDELTDLFGRMGFSTASGPEVEDEFHNFVAAGIFPEQHPARAARPVG